MEHYFRMLLFIFAKGKINIFYKNWKKLTFIEHLYMWDAVPNNFI